LEVSLDNKFIEFTSNGVATFLIDEIVISTFAPSSPSQLFPAELTPNDKFIVLASDGVSAFLTNQTVPTNRPDLFPVGAHPRETS
jgi:hypothetical protein